VLAALIIFVATYLFLAGAELPFLNLDRPGGAVAGAVAMVVFGVLTPEQVYRDAISWDTLVLLPRDDGDDERDGARPASSNGSPGWRCGGPKVRVPCSRSWCAGGGLPLGVVGERHRLSHVYAAGGRR